MKSQNITDGSRSYRDACGTAHALDLIGERWALLVIRELMLGPKRFSDLKFDLPGISANVLTQRLEGLEAGGQLRRRKLPPPSGVQVYELTDWGYEAEPILQALGRWATRSPGHDPRLPLSATALLLSFRAMADTARVGDLEARIGFRIRDETFVAEVGGGRVHTRRGETGGAQAVFTGAPEAIAAAIYGGASFEALKDVLEVEGDRALARRFATFFPLPPKAVPPSQ